MGDLRREHGYHGLRVSRVVRETADTSSFVLEVPGELAEVFRYRAGQFCTFRVRLDGVEQLRSYSMSSAPETGDELTVTVKRVASGVVSNWFNDTVEAGDVLEVTKPAGVFCVRESERPVLAFCGGSGVTPVLSIAKSVLTATRRPVRIFYANRDRESVIFADQLRRLQDRHPGRLEVRHHFDSEDGFPSVRTITDFAGEDLDADFYLCGPAPFMDLVEGSLVGLGVEDPDIFIERFGDAPARRSTVDDGAAEVPETVTIILGGKKTTVAYQPGDTVLETARRGGLQPPFSCEAGNCATCMAVLRAGSARMRENNALEDDEVEEGWILTCQALPEGPGPTTVEYESF
ncbi:ferredoxin--NADP reductase [Amycolatopsis acidicola]|uniref:Ferredoxin--NADP reductase n=1 Tax=Amycolatopsis acidicola TaxID=2596893 RepID=A0A5N0UQ91_9PSEU|nr:ferredoxin--NADP reductase [Amycolatopsis acidicola]KAA9151069.1 ferredoxin--NADP reductase [Amycolatopsis acidicola]